MGKSGTEDNYVWLMLTIYEGREPFNNNYII
jgi:hypothetical protein